MVLTITALRYKGRPLDSPLSAVFQQQGGKLGRASGNHFVLDDEEKVVSGEHAIIAYENGDYFYIDTSLNGTQITNRNKRIHRDKILLKDRDELQIGDYELILSISPDASEPSQQPIVANPASSMPLADPDEATDHEPVASDDFVSDGNHIPHDNPMPYDDSDLGMALNVDFNPTIDESFLPPDVETPPTQPQALPEHLSLEDFFGDDPSSLKMFNGLDHSRQQAPVEGFRSCVAPPPDKSVAPSDAYDVRASDAAADLPGIFLKAAGIEDVNGLSQDRLPELMTVIGTVFRELVEGLMTVLRSRSELKSHLRVAMTTLKPTENNPLKFSPTVEEALKSLVTNSNPGFIDPVGAVREGYEDIKNHQLAVTAGVQASLVSILKQFDPQHISEKFEGALVLKKKAKCWDEFRHAYQQIVEDALETFFGDDFVRGYEEQIDKLRTHRKSN